jgi:hypothetical protein
LESACSSSRVFCPLPLPSSATSTGAGSSETISCESRCSNRIPARLNPYSGSKQITSKSAEPTSSYKYFEGSSFCPAWLSPTTTSLENSAITAGETLALAMRGADAIAYSSTQRKLL